MGQGNACFAYLGLEAARFQLFFLFIQMLLVLALELRFFLLYEKGRVVSTFLAKLLPKLVVSCLSELFGLQAHGRVSYHL